MHRIISRENNSEIRRTWLRITRIRLQHLLTASKSEKAQGSILRPNIHRYIQQLWTNLRSVMKCGTYTIIIIKTFVLNFNYQYLIYVLSKLLHLNFIIDFLAIQK